MMLRILIALYCLGCPMAAQERSCVAPESDHILGKDLARAFPEFSSMPGGAVLAASPMAGARRVFHAQETADLAARYSIKIELPRDVCFEWEMQLLDRTGVLEAMRSSLGVPEARIEIAEAMLGRVPKGRIEFPREGLGKPASYDQPSPVVWRGSITYGGGRRFAIWAKAIIAVPVNIVIAAETLKAGQPIRVEQLKVARKDRFPDLQNSSLNLQQAAGLVPLRSISSGAEVRTDNLVRPNDVSRGDWVAIEVRSGSARLTFSGRAESAGHTGDMIAIRNPESNKIFRARVCAKDKAIVEPDVSRVN